MKESPYAGRAKVEETLRDLTIEIPVKRNIFVFLFLSFWLCMWLFGELSVLVMLLGAVLHFSVGGLDSFGVLSFEYIFLSFWFVAWTFGGFFALKSWIWMFKGKEIIKINREELSIAKKYSIFSPDKSYDIKEIKNIQLNTSISSFPFLGNLSNFSFPGMATTGSLKFDYGFKTILFASGLDEAEAKYLLEKINDKGFIG